MSQAAHWIADRVVLVIVVLLAVVVFAAVSISAWLTDNRVDSEVDDRTEQIVDSRFRECRSDERLRQELIDYLRAKDESVLAILETSRPDLVPLVSSAFADALAKLDRPPIDCREWAETGRRVPR